MVLALNDEGVVQRAVPVQRDSHPLWVLIAQFIVPNARDVQAYLMILQSVAGYLLYREQRVVTEDIHWVLARTSGLLDVFRRAGAEEDYEKACRIAVDALRDYPGLSNSERITFEYVMLDGVNDSHADARELVRLLKGIPAKINLIPFNPWPGTRYTCSDWERIEAFADIVYKAGYASPIRTPRGEDIMAACGQLKSATERARKSSKEIAAEAGL